MTTTKDSQQHEIKDLSTAEEDIHVSNDGESSPLIGNNWRRITLRMLPNLHVRYQRCCLTSNAVIHILVWKLILVVGFESFLDTGYFDSIFREEPDKLIITILGGASYSMLVILFLFYPLAGCLADIRWGRYKTVVYSLRVIGGSLVLAVVLVCLAPLSFIPVMIKANNYDLDYDYPSSTIQIITLTVVCVVFGLPVFIAVLFMLGGLVCFSANVIATIWDRFAP